jgi:hypothetical protein
MAQESLEDRADRLIQHGWLMCIADLVTAEKLPDVARDMMRHNGITRDMALRSGLEPYTLRAILSLFPKPEFVAAPIEPRTVRIVRVPEMAIVGDAYKRRFDRENAPFSGGDAA